MITSDEPILPPSLVCEQNASHLHLLCVGILLNSTALGIHLKYAEFRKFTISKRGLAVKFIRLT